jgi:hypothetical protein
MGKENFIQSSLDQSPEEKAKAYKDKIREIEKIAYRKGYEAGLKAKAKR